MNWKKKSAPRDQLKKFDIDKEMKSNMTTTPMTEAIDNMTTVKTTGINVGNDIKSEKQIRRMM